jgi:hypothetical protein
MFGNKKKQEEKKEEKTEMGKAEYKIVLLEKLGGTVREIGQPFFAKRFIDEEDKVVYLQNPHKSKKFLEIFPQQVNEFRNYTKEQVKELIAKNEKILEREKIQDSQEINDKDIEYTLLKLKALLRSFKFDDNSSYLSFDGNGRPTFHFLREGSTFFPFKWDTETKTIFTPSDNRKKSASLSLRNKQNKYNTKKLLDGASILLIIVGFIMCAGAAYMWLKTTNAYGDAFDKYEASEIAAAQRSCLETINGVAHSLTKSAEGVEKITQSIEEELNKPQTVINGVIPE